MWPRVHTSFIFTSTENYYHPYSHSKLGNAQILRLPTKRRHTRSNHNNIIPYIKLYQIVSHPLRSKLSLNYIADTIIEKWCLSWLRLPLKNTIVWGGLNNRNLFLTILEAENSKMKMPRSISFETLLLASKWLPSGYRLKWPLLCTWWGWGRKYCRKG